MGWLTLSVLSVLLRNVNAMSGSDKLVRTRNGAQKTAHAQSGLVLNEGDAPSFSEVNTSSTRCFEEIKLTGFPDEEFNGKYTWLSDEDGNIVVRDGNAVYKNDHGKYLYWKHMAWIGDTGGQWNADGSYAVSSTYRPSYAVSSTISKRVCPDQVMWYLLEHWQGSAWMPGPFRVTGVPDCCEDIMIEGYGLFERLRSTRDGFYIYKNQQTGMRLSYCDVGDPPLRKWRIANYHDTFMDFDLENKKQGQAPEKKCKEGVFSSAVTNVCPEVAIPTATCVPPDSFCKVDFYKGKYCEGPWVGSVRTSSISGEDFTQIEDTKNWASKAISVKVGRNCERVELLDEDACKKGYSDNLVLPTVPPAGWPFSGKAYDKYCHELPWDLQEDLCGASLQFSE